MEKSIEERLSNIEDGIAKLMKIQRSGFGLLSTSVRLLKLYERAQWTMTSAKQSLDPLHRHLDFMHIFLFGSMGYVGVGVSLLALAHTVNESFFKAMGIAFIVMAIGFNLYVIQKNRGARSKLRKTESKLTRTEDEIKRIEGELDDIEAYLEKQETNGKG